MGNYNDYLDYLKHIDNTTEQEIKAKVDGLNDEITSLKNNVANLTRIKDGLTTDLVNANREINAKVDFINIKETELIKVEADLKQTKKELKDTQSKLLKLENKYTISEEKNASLSNEIAELQKKQLALKSESDKYQKDLKDINLKLSELKDVYVNEKDHNTSLNNQISELKSKYIVLKTELKNKNSNVENYISEIQKLHLELETAKGDFENVKSNSSEFNEQIKKYKEQINTLNKTIDELNRQNNSSELTDLKVKLDIVERRLNLSESENSRINTETVKIKEYNENLKRSLIAKNEELEKLEFKNRIMYVSSFFGLLFLFTTIVFFRQYQSADNLYLSKSFELSKKEILIDSLKEQIFQTGKFLIVKDAKFKTYEGVGLSFDSSLLKRVTPIINVYSFATKEVEVIIKYDAKNPDGSRKIYKNKGYYIDTQFTIKPGDNTLVFDGFWGYDEAGKFKKGNYTYTFYSNTLINDFSKDLTVK